MIRRLLPALTVAAVALAGPTIVATPASASDLPGAICILNQNSWLRAAPDSPIILRTLTAGRGFRLHDNLSTGSGIWAYGHGAEAPSQDGWIPWGNISNCYWPY